MKENQKLADNIIDFIQSLYDHAISIADAVHEQQELYLDQNHLRYQFNVISAAARGKLKETAHSLILSYMLQHPDIQKSFLATFLSINDSDTLKVKVEFGDSHNHIDIILHDKQQCIIIENKANNAVEQPQQVHRYVHDIAELQLKIKREHIYVLYLNPWDRTPPSKQSVTDVDGKDNVRNSLGERFQVRSFAHDIPQWLEAIITNFKEEPIIESGIKQYLDYLQNYFYTSQIYNNMNLEIEQQILEAYNINEDMPLSAQIKILSAKKENVNNLANHLNNIIQNKETEYAIERLTSIYRQMEIDFQNLEDVNFYNNLQRRPYPNIGLGVMLQGMRVNFHIEYDCDTTKIYYGIICSRENFKDAYDKLSETYNPYLNTLPSEPQEPSPYWPAWRYTSFENAYSRFKALLNFGISHKNK